MSSVLVLGVALSGCGLDLGMSLPIPAAPVVRLSTPVERETHQVVRRSYIVAFRSQVGASLLRFASFRDEYRHNFAYLAEGRLSDQRVRDLRYLATVDLSGAGRRRGVGPASNLAGPLQLAWDQSRLPEKPAAISAVDFASDEDAASVLAEWEAQGAIWFAEPNYTNRLLDNPFTTELADRYKNADIWWHQRIRLPEALAKLAAANVTTNQTPVIAILDSGVDIEHPALKNHIFSNPTPGVSGCPDDVHGCDTSRATRGDLGVGSVFPYTTDAYGKTCPRKSFDDDDVGICEHGTHVAGIIAADLGINAADQFQASLSPVVGGVCPVCKILPVKIISSDEEKGTASDEAIINALQYVALFRADGRSAVRVVNSSFGKYAPNRAVELLVNVLTESASQILVVAAASNEDSMLRSYPAAYPGVLSVAATGGEDEKASYSNFGPWVQVSAPGGNKINGRQINSTVPGGSFSEKQGTSMASPVVAGVAGLILAYDQNRSVEALRNSIIATADRRIYDPSVNNGNNYLYYNPLVAGSPTRWPLLGSGIVDVLAALDGKGANYSGTVYDRVQSGCGTVQSAAQSHVSIWWLLLAPMLMVLL